MLLTVIQPNFQKYGNSFKYFNYLFIFELCIDNDVFRSSLINSNVSLK